MINTYDQAYKSLSKYESDFFMSIMLAQWALESDYGNSELATQALNYTGHKTTGWTGEVYLKDTIEDDGKGNKYIAKSEPFRKYASPDDWAKAHSSWLQRLPEVYAKAINAKTVEEQAGALQGTYATDTSYKKKLLDIIERDTLRKYDTAEGAGSVANKWTAETLLKHVFGTETILSNMFNGTAGARGSDPEGAIIHNDYGRANGKGYLSWLATARTPHTKKAELGFAHYYIDRIFNVRVEHTYNKAYHGGNSYANSRLLGYEVNESLSTTDAEFIQNEEAVFIQVAEDLLFYNLPINRKTVRLHKEFSSTSCPHRSWELHVGKGQPDTQANIYKLQDYFISRVKFWADVLEGKRDVSEFTGKSAGGATSPEPNNSPTSDFDLPAYKEPTKPFKELKVDDTATVREPHEAWYIPATNKGRKPTKDLTGHKFKITRVIECEVGYSKRAYLLDGPVSFILEQDVVEARDGWNAEDKDQQKQLDYVYIDGVKRIIGDTID